MASSLFDPLRWKEMRALGQMMLDAMHEGSDGIDQLPDSLHRVMRDVQARVRHVRTMQDLRAQVAELNGRVAALEAKV